MSENKRVILVSHCVLNSYCELPQAPENLRKQIVNILVDKGISIVQLPCPELLYQEIDRNSIYPDDECAREYREFCKEVIKPTVKTIEEYNKYNIEIVGIIGIEASPSCSMLDARSMMMEVLLYEIQRRDIEVGQLVDMPTSKEGRNENFLNYLENL